jgi:hypothetical protein
MERRAPEYSLGFMMSEGIDMASRSRADPGTGSGPPKYPGTFLLAFREAVAELNWQIRSWTSQLVECADDKGLNHSVGLDTFYERVRPSPREEWPALIAQLLRTLSSQP